MTRSDKAITSKMHAEVITDKNAYPRVLITADVVLAKWGEVETINTGFIEESITEAVRLAVGFKEKEAQK